MSPPSPQTSAASRPLVIYDDACGFCGASVRWLGRLDWLNRLAFEGYSSAVLRYPEVARGELDEGIRLRLPDGRVRVGIYALRAIALRLPLTFVPALTLLFPPVRWVAGRVYAALARRRSAISCRLGLNEPSDPPVQAE